LKEIFKLLKLGLGDGSPPQIIGGRVQQIIGDMFRYVNGSLPADFRQ